MILRGIDFGRVFNASGARNFFGNGWWYSWVFWLFGLRWAGSTFVTKTVLAEYRRGNMRLLPWTTMPLELIPRCIYISYKSWRAGCMLNSVGLTCPGIRALLAAGRWQKWERPFVISIGLVENDWREKQGEISKLCVALNGRNKKFAAKFALEINISCPNIHNDPVEMEKQFSQARTILCRFASLCVPIIVKINALTPTEWVVAFQNERMCDAITVSNSLPYGSFPDRIDWEGLFGRESPLKRFGGGGLSGRPIHPIVVEWIQNARAAGFALPIIGGGGVLSIKEAQEMLEAGANAIALGSISPLRFWRVAAIIRWVNQRQRREDGSLQSAHAG